MPQKEKQMTNNIIATERKTNDRQYNSHGKKKPKPIRTVV